MTALFHNSDNATFSSPKDTSLNKNNGKRHLIDRESKSITEALSEDYHSNGLRDTAFSVSPASQLNQLPSHEVSLGIHVSNGHAEKNEKDPGSEEEIRLLKGHVLGQLANGAEHAKNGFVQQLLRSKNAIEMDAEELKTGVHNLHHLETRAAQNQDRGRFLKLSPAKLFDLTSSPASLPKGNPPPGLETIQIHNDVHTADYEGSQSGSNSSERLHVCRNQKISNPRSSFGSINVSSDTGDLQKNPDPLSVEPLNYVSRPSMVSRTVSTPPLSDGFPNFNLQKVNSLQPSHPSPSLPRHSAADPSPLQLPAAKSGTVSSTLDEPTPSPVPQSIPLPPFSLPTYLQLELSSKKPSPLYIHRSGTSDIPYESSRVKLERLQNFLLLPPQLEQVIWFGVLACLDAWLFSFTILPLRFLKALMILFQSWGRNAAKETRNIGRFVCSGSRGMWRKRQRRNGIDTAANGFSNGVNHFLEGPKSFDPLHSGSRPFPTTKADCSCTNRPHPEVDQKTCNDVKIHRKSKSMPSALLPAQKADLLKGLLITISCTILMCFDASRMYHGIRGQAAIKLYVIYNVLEVCDRLFSALGQDVLECLFSNETLERKPNGRSKVLRPLWLFILALIYNLVHATSLFYQVVTLNVAVNSYSNALLTLLISNQFVEIKSTVFKKFEKENLFQLTCADVVERFQLWLMLTIIASRNIIETGGLSLALGSSSGANAGSGSASAIPHGGSGVLPQSFTMLPVWTGQVMGPFVLVLGSEMIVDWIKHAYITKFNNTKPAIYGRYLDVLAKDYYSSAFTDQNLTRRLGLPVIPLASLFIRASVQTYHMFVATYVPLPVPSTATSLTVESSSASPATTAALQHVDQIFRRALGRSSFGFGGSTNATPSNGWTTDDVIAFTTMAVLFLVFFLVLLALKLVLGMCLLSFARRRYRGMKERETAPVHADGKRVGGWGVIEVNEDKRRWIYHDEPGGARRMKEKEVMLKEKEGTSSSFSGLNRYSMAAKRIW